MFARCSVCCGSFGFLGFYDQGQEINYNSITVILLSRLPVEHTRDDLQTSTREAGEHQVVLPGGSQDQVLSSQSHNEPQWCHSLCQTCSSYRQGYGQRDSGDDSQELHRRVQVQHQESGFSDCVGKGECCVVARSQSRRMRDVSTDCSDMEEYSSGHRLFRSYLGINPLRLGDVRHVGHGGCEEDHCTQGVAGLRHHCQEEPGLPEGEAGHLACGQSERQVGFHQSGFSKRSLAVQKSCGTSPATQGISDLDCSRLCPLSPSSPRRLSQPEKADSRLASSSRSCDENLLPARSARDRSDGNKQDSPAGQVLLPCPGRGGSGCGQPGAGLGQVRDKLCVSSPSHDGTSSEQNLSMQKQDSISGSFTLETSLNMVSKGSGSLNGRSSQVTSQPSVSDRSVSINMSSSHTLWQGDEIRRVEAFWRGRNQSGGLSTRTQFIIQSSWAQGTKSVYGLGFRYYCEFCKKHNLDPFAPDPVNLLNFLTYYFEIKKSEFRTLNCYRSAISSTLGPDPRTGFPVGQDPLVSRFFKGVRRLRPPKSKLFPTWSVSAVLRHLKTLGDSKSLNLSTLLKKTCFLVALVCCKRPACLHNMQKVQGYWELSMSGLRCQTLGLSKTEVHNVAPPIIIEPFNEDPALCPVYHLVRLDKKLDKLRGKDVVRFWLSSKKPHKPVSTQTICKWLSSIITESGAVSGTARDVRSAGSSTALQSGMDLGKILQAADWRRVSTFQRHYFKPQRLESLTNILKVGNDCE